MSKSKEELIEEIEIFKKLKPIIMGSPTVVPVKKKKKKRGRPLGTIKGKKRTSYIVVGVKDLDSDKKTVLPQIVTETFKTTADYSRRSTDYDLMKIEKEAFLEIMRELKSKLNKACEQNITKELMEEKIAKKEAELGKLKGRYNKRYKKKASWYDGEEEEEDSSEVPF